ncbi:transporter substrate-binding domain-containing protein [Rubrimonas cliftonensis]|nr:transporter substrate-binding domain-containing protein [Rubrimonas cliftonensis]
MARTPIAAAALVAAFALPAAAQDLRICVEGAYPPFSQVSDAGELEGFDIDIAKALCAEMGASCEMVQTEWDAIIPTLEEGKCDAILASMSITEERKQRIDFTGKYYQTAASFVAPEGFDAEITDAGLAGKTVCVQRGSIHQAFIEGEFPSASLVLYPTQDEVYLDLTSGRCDAAMQDSIAAQDGFLNTPAGEGFAFVGPAYSVPRYHGEGAGIGVRKSDTELRDRLSAAILAIRESGVYKEINDAYFPFDVYDG